MTPWSKDDIRITGPAADVLLALGIDGKPLPKLVFSRPKEGTCAGVPLSGDARLYLDGRSLMLDVTGTRSTIGDRRQKTSGDRQVDLRLANGSRLTARFADLARRGMSLEVGKSARSTMLFDIDVWTIEGRTKPEVWVGEILGGDIGTGNVILSAGSRWEWGAVRLPGNYVWYLRK